MIDIVKRKQLNKLLERYNSKKRLLKEATEVTKSISLDVIDNDNQLESILKYIRKGLIAGQSVQVSIRTESDEKDFMLSGNTKINSLGIDETIDTVDEDDLV